MNGYVKPTQKPESNLEISEARIQELPDNELDAIAGGYPIVMSDLLVSSVVKKPAEHYKIDFADIIISS